MGQHVRTRPVARDLPIDQIQHNGKVSTPNTSGKIQAFMALSGGLPEDQFIDEDDSPGILFTGTNDRIVPMSYSTTVGQALNAAGVEAKVVTFQGAGHVPWGQKATILADTTDFFYKHLNLASAAAPG